MKKFLLFSILAVLFISSRIQSQILPLKREFRGAWIATVANINWPTSPGLPSQTQREQLIKILDGLTASKFNAVVFQIRPECDAFYKSPYEPWSYWLTGAQGVAPSDNYDPLEFAVQEAHKRGLEFHAWFNPYRAERSVGYYTTASTHVTNAHADWVLRVTTTTNGIKSDIKFLDPGQQQVRDHVAKVISDVVRRYDIDAAHMDDYFYVEPMGNQDATTFATSPRGFADLGDWRRDNVNLLIKQVYDSIQVIKPWVKWGISPRGIWKNGTPTGTSGNDNYSTIYCDATAWLNGKYIDYIAPQLYWKFGGNQDYGKLQPWWASQSNGRHFYPGLADYRIGTSSYGTASEVANQIRFNRTSQNVHGHIHYHGGNVLDNLGGINDTLKNDLFLYSALIPQMMWKDSIAPNVPMNIRYERIAGKGPAVLRWDIPTPASDGNTAARYVMFRKTNQIFDKEDQSAILSVVGDAQALPSTPVTINQPYYYAVTALDRNYNESGLSNSVAVSAPGVPMLALPLDGTINVPPVLNVQWNAPNTAAMYQLQVSSDSMFASNVLVNDASLLDTVKTILNMRGEQQYFWRVGASNAGGTSSFSAKRFFTTGFPAIPVIAYPTNLMTSVPLQISLKWNKNKIATSYHVQLSSSFAFDSAFILAEGITSDTMLAAPTLQPNTIYFWRMTASNAIGTSGWSEIWKFKTTTSLYASLSSNTPSEFQLQQNYPNPFNPTTVISYQLPVTNHVSLRVYDVLGRETATLVDEQQPAGFYNYQLSISSYHLSSGVYFYRLQAGNFTATRKMIVQK